ncbi:MAG TPA: lipid A deacylase LpxR family protein [Alphaproteobacteria bacterium]|nr:lipid A deacylase LpxR family protein [Alphaproteobacteria bacterium]
MKMHWGLLVGLLALPVAAFAQEVEGGPVGLPMGVSYSSVISPSVQAGQTLEDRFKKGDRMFTLSAENDSLTRSGDRYYTNGLRLSWLELKSRPPEWAEWVAEHVPMFNAGNPMAVQYTIGQNMYTPSKINIYGPQYGDRPYAGYLYGSVGLTEGDGDVVNDLEMSLGVVGPLSFAEQTQVNFHHLIHVHPPKGWDNQLHNEPAIGLSWARRWPTFWETPVWGGGAVGLMPSVGVTVGNVYDLASAGASLMWRSDASAVMDNPLRVRPSIPGTGYYATNSKPVFTLSVGAEQRAVARNIFLDGNTFGDNDINVQKRNFVTDLQASAGVSWNRYRLAYTTVYRTKEFYGQRRGQVFGGLNFSFKY